MGGGRTGSVAVDIMIMILFHFSPTKNVQCMQLQFPFFSQIQSVYALEVFTSG